jgi:hypothetical protein
MLLAVFNKKLKADALEAVKRVYGEVLEHFPQSIITAAFTKAEREFERWPTPKRMAEVCNELVPPHSTAPVLVCRLCKPDGWKLIPKPMPPAVYELIGPGNKPTGETSAVPQQQAVRCDHFGERTFYDDEEVFRAEDCPEGREFLAKLREIAGKSKAPPPESPTAPAIPDAAPAVPCPRWPHLIAKGILYGPGRT